ncbi:O-methyltransferase [Xylaria sp. CBS 124048]|nr:O-methyltransferase [Xylaria sp. CBS 124048]
MALQRKVFSLDPTHVQNKTWTAVDAYTLSHVNPSTKPHHQVLAAVLQNSIDQGLPDIATPPVLAKFYALQCKANNVKHALEFGTLGAYTPIWLTTMNPELRVTSIEFDENCKRIAQENLTMAGVHDRVSIRLGAGLDILPQVAEEIKSGKKPKLGFVYIDADKENNWNYLDQSIPLCEPGALIYVDNVVRGGRLVDPEDQDVSTLGARHVIEMAGKDDRIESVVLQSVGEKSYDGMLLAIVL